MTSFSVVIPTYNCLSFLKLALDSVFNQSFPASEVIVIDNCSTDGTREYLESLTHINLNVISFSNKGIIAASRNIGIRASTSDWICFLDADDLWHVDKLLSLSSSISLHPEVDVFCHNEYILKHNRLAGHLLHGPSSPNMARSLLLLGNRLSTSALYQIILP